MESKKINQLATELAPDLSDLTIIGDPTTGISKKITLSQMASLFTGTVEEYANLAAFPLVGVADTIYIALDTNVIYRYDTSLSAYVILSPNIINSLVFSDANGFDGTIALVGSVANLTITTALTSGSVPFIGASGALTQDNSNLFFDDTNNRLGIATASPTTPLDVFGSGIIGRLNATSTNNAYLGFASNGTNKWSAGNVQSDHRFRIFSEANSAELITILQTGEFGIGISNPTTKFHIDGAASALIANLDANVSIAKSVSYRSDNSARINLEVSGTESGSNVGADFFLRTFTDAGSLLETPFTIVRSTGVTTIKSLTLTNVLSVANGGTGSATQNFVDLTSIQTAAGAKTFSAITTISNATASTSTTTGGLVVTGGVGIGGALFLSGNLDVSGTGRFTENLLVGAALGSTKSVTAASFSSPPASGYNAQIDYTGGTRISQTTPSSESSDAITFVINGGSTSTTGNYFDFKTQTGNTTPASVMRITKSGNIGIGNTTALHKVQIGSNADQNTSIGKSILYLSGNAGNLGYVNEIGFGDVSETNPQSAIGNIITNATASSYGDLYFATRNVTTNTAPTERMRITGAGLVLINTTSAISGCFVGIAADLSPYNGLVIKNTNASLLGNYILFSNSSNTTSGYISQATSTTVLYVTSSDYRLKENVKPIQNAIDRVLKINAVTYNWKDTNNEIGEGFIAHELQDIVPLAVSGQKDAINEDGSIKVQGIDYGKLTPLLVAAIQELKAEIDLLKAK